ncbi:hypothetical protein JCM16303_005458 [Sporobolomyces ruberrimus]
MVAHQRSSIQSSTSSPHFDQSSDLSSTTSPSNDDHDSRLSAASTHRGDKGETTINQRDKVERPRPRRTFSAPSIPLNQQPITPKPTSLHSQQDHNVVKTSNEPRRIERDSLLVPPQYGRPARPSSPDVFNALFHPVLRSLSRPSSPSPHRPSSPNLPDPTSLADSEPAQASSRAQTSLPSHFPPRNPTDPAPTIESQGFLLYISSLLFYLLYLAWSIFPDQVLERIGLEWYPSREWALLIPSWITMTVLYVYLGYFFLNMSNTLTLGESLETLDDPKSFIPPPPAPPSLLSSLPRPPTSSEEGIEARTHITRLYLDSILLPPEAIPPLYDLPLDVVNRVLYGIE